jgi:transcriptional regulator with XRE-family HTH domain
MSTATELVPFGSLLREWRGRRRVSQLELSSEAGVSTRHLSFIETGRASPSRDMVIRLSEYLDMPLRERNSLLLAAGYAPAYPQTPLSAESMRDVRRSLQSLVDAHRPCPAAAVDHGWNLVLANDSALSLSTACPMTCFAIHSTSSGSPCTPTGCAAASSTSTPTVHTCCSDCNVKSALPAIQPSVS